MSMYNKSFQKMRCSSPGVHGLSVHADGPGRLHPPVPCGAAGGCPVWPAGTLPACGLCRGWGQHCDRGDEEPHTHGDTVPLVNTVSLLLCSGCWSGSRPTRWVWPGRSSSLASLWATWFSDHCRTGSGGGLSTWLVRSGGLWERQTVAAIDHNNRPSAF